MAVACHLWPAISPHGRHVPTSIWNLPLRTWLMLAKQVDEHVKAREKG